MWGKTSKFLILSMMSLCLFSCVEEIQRDTGNLVTTMEQLEKHAGSMAVSLSKLEATTEKTFTEVSARVESFEANFEKGMEQIQAMVDSFVKLERLLEMADYVKKMSDNLEGLTGTFEKIDELTVEIKSILDGLNINFEPQENESFDKFFDEEDFQEVEETDGVTS